MMLFRRRRFFQSVCCVLFVMLLYQVFFRPRKAPSRVKLQGTKGERLVSVNERNLVAHFLSPWRHRPRRRMSPGIVEVESQEPGFRDVRPPLYMPREPQGEELALRVGKQKRSLRKHSWMNGISPDRRARKVRSAVLKDGATEENLSGIRNTFLRERLHDTGQSRRMHEAVDLSFLHAVRESGGEDRQEWNSNRKHKVGNEQTLSGGIGENNNKDQHLSAHTNQTTERPPNLELDSDEQTSEHLETSLVLRETEQEADDSDKQTSRHSETSLTRETEEDPDWSSNASVHGFTTPTQNTSERNPADWDPRQHSLVRRQAPEPIPPSLPRPVRQAIAQYFRHTSHFSRSRRAGRDVEFSCQNTAMDAFRKHKFVRETRWTFNGRPVSVQDRRMQFRGQDALVIQGLTVSDTGVYECRVVFDADLKTATLGVFALTVTSPRPTLTARETEPLLLHPHSSFLARVLTAADLTLADNSSHETTRRWYFKGSPSPLLPREIRADRPGPDRIAASIPGLAGEWWCEVTHRNTARRWNTSWYRVAIGDPPPALERWWRSVLQRPWLVSVAGVVLLLTCMGLSLLLARCTQVRHENLEISWQRTKARIMKRESELNVVRSASFTSAMSTLSRAPSETQEEEDPSHLPELVFSPPSATSRPSDTTVTSKNSFRTDS